MHSLEDVHNIESWHEKIYINRVFKDIYADDIFVCLDRGILIVEPNPQLIIVDSELEIIEMKENKVFDEIIVLEGKKDLFEDIDDFFSYSLIRAGIVNTSTLTIMKPMSKANFDDILDWGFLGVFSYEMEIPLSFAYCNFHAAFLNYEHPSKPLFCAGLDHAYYTFINNSYT